MKRDYYEVLGLNKGAADHDIKSAYRRLAKEFHPGPESGRHTAEIHFKEVSEAYEALKDPQKRAAYDQFGHAAFDGSMDRTAPPRVRQRLLGVDVRDFRRLVRRIHGRPPHRGRSAKERGSDLKYNMEISLVEAFTGKAAQIRVPASVTCEDCGGAGAEAGSSPITCPTCQGFGKVRASQGFFTIERTCVDLSGARRDHPEALPNLLRQRPCYARTHAVGEHPSGR